MVQQIAWKILREGKHKQVSGVLGFLTRNIADVEKKNTTKKPQGGDLPRQWKHEQEM